MAKSKVLIKYKKDRPTWQYKFDNMEHYLATPIINDGTEETRKEALIWAKNMYEDIKSKRIIDPIIKKKQDIGYVYFLKGKTKGKQLCKIGFTRNLKQRISCVSDEVFEESNLFAYLISDNVEILEKKFHELFKNKRVFSEYFELSEEDYKNILLNGLSLVA